MACSPVSWSRRAPPSGKDDPLTGEGWFRNLPSGRVDGHPRVRRREDGSVLTSWAQRARIDTAEGGVSAYTFWES